MTRGNKILICVFATLMVGSMVLAGIFIYFVEGKPVTLVVTLEQNAGQANRDLLKRDCAGLPGTSVIADRGNPSPVIQGRFPVRFDISDATDAQEAALEACINRHADFVRGYISEGDR